MTNSIKIELLRTKNRTLYSCFHVLTQKSRNRKRFKVLCEQLTEILHSRTGSHWIGNVRSHDFCVFGQYQRLYQIANSFLPVQSIRYIDCLKHVQLHIIASIVYVVVLRTTDFSNSLRSKTTTTNVSFFGHCDVFLYLFLSLWFFPHFFSTTTPSPQFARKT